MKVKLLTSIEHLGRAGEIVDVSDPQARNYLIPKKMAVLATGTVVAAHQRDAAKNQADRQRQQAQIAQLLEQFSAQPLELAGRANAQGKLFAAIKMNDIRLALEKKYHLKLTTMTCQPDHLKTVGSHQIEVTIDHAHRAIITIIVHHGT